MKALPTLSMRLALLLALIMPLQGFASAWSCTALDGASADAPQHCAHETGAAPQHHTCGTCCCTAAIAVMPVPWAAARQTSSDLLLPLRGSPLKVVLDRLDRPPRYATS
jgi:hypothetical protein